jgi:hypothetical protein
MRLLPSAVVIAGICLAGVPSAATSSGRLSLYTDASFTNCALADAAPGVVTVYMAEWSDYGATGLRFRIAGSPGFTGVWLSETSPFVTVGNSKTDLSIGFGLCLTNRFLVLTMSYQMFGTSTCSQLSIVAAAGQREPICTACSFGEYPCYGYDPLHVNCGGSFECNPVSTEPSTWGRVKSLYRN